MNDVIKNYMTLINGECEYIKTGYELECPTFYLDHRYINEQNNDKEFENKLNDMRLFMHRVSAYYFYSKEEKNLKSFITSYLKIIKNTDNYSPSDDEINKEIEEIKNQWKTTNESMMLYGYTTDEGIPIDFIIQEAIDTDDKKEMYYEIIYKNKEYLESFRDRINEFGVSYETIKQFIINFYNYITGIFGLDFSIAYKAYILTDNKYKKEKFEDLKLSNLDPDMNDQKNITLSKEYWERTVLPNFMNKYNDLPDELTNDEEVEKLKDEEYVQTGTDPINNKDYEFKINILEDVYMAHSNVINKYYLPDIDENNDSCPKGDYSGFFDIINDKYTDEEYPDKITHEYLDSGIIYLDCLDVTCLSYKEKAERQKEQDELKRKQEEEQAKLNNENS